MGSFFSNIHFYSQRDSKDDVLMDVSEALVRMATNGPYIEAKEDEFADRTILIFPTENPYWYVIFDEDAESQDIRISDELGKTVSKIVDVTAISILVHDSDYLRLGLFKDGDKKDTLKIRDHLKRKGLKKKYWLELLAEEDILGLGEKLKDMKSVSEDHLEIIADSLHWDKRYCFLGYEYRDEAPRSEPVRLRFRISDENQFLKYNEGLPYLDSGQREMGYPIQINKRMMLRATLTNEGGRCKGISAFVVVEDNLLDKMKFYNARICAHASNSKQFKSEFKPQEQQGQHFLVTNFNEVEVGANYEFIGKGMMNPWQNIKASKACQMYQLWGNVLVEPLVLGDIEIKIWYVPHQNQKEGAVLFTYNMEVVEKIGSLPYEPEI